MNRPSRTEDDLEHPTWNQSPPFLAADLTTRQDLNGIANAREHRHGCADVSNSAGWLIDGKHPGGVLVLGECDKESLVQPPLAMSGRLYRKQPMGSLDAIRMAHGADQNNLQARSLHPRQCLVVKARPVPLFAQSGPPQVGLAGSRRSWPRRR
jgi:hypothetical protein